MPQNPDIQYIRVRHLGVTDGSLHIDDLDTEANKKQPYQIPVYIPEGGSVDLPLNDQVLLSFNQGTLRSFINQGLASGFVIKDDGSAEVWVSPNGDDSNPGTRTAPFASIQYAIDELVDRVGHLAFKRVNVSPGTYSKPVIIYTKNIHVRNTALGGLGTPSESDSEVYIDAETFEPSDEGMPALFITNGTKEEAEDYLAGKSSFYISKSASGLTYNGPTTTNREVSYSPINPSPIWGYHAGVLVDGISAVSGGSEGVLIVSMTDQSSDYLLRNVILRNAAHANLYARFVLGITVEYLAGVCLLLNSGNLTLAPSRPWKTSQALLNGGVVCDADTDSITTMPVFKPSGYNILIRDPLSVVGNAVLFNTNRSADLIFDEGMTEPLVIDTSNGVTASSTAIPHIKCASITLSSAAGLKVNHLNVKNITMDSTDQLIVGQLDVLENIVITDGTLTANGGTIKGNFTVSGGSNIDLTGVHVLGDVDLTGAGIVTWRGGSFYGTLTDPGNKLGGALPGDYLNVTP